MNTLFSLILTFYLFITPLYSVSAPPFPYEVEQPGGSKISVRMFGHEYYNWLETEDGYVIDWVEDDNRSGWYYSKLNDEGKFSPTHIPVEYPAPNNLNIPRKLRESNPQVRKITHGDRHLGNFHNSNLQRSTATTLIKPLVFLVDFDNSPSGVPDREYTKEQFQQLLFKSDLESDGSTLHANYDMSVRDYYHEISNGKLEVYGDDASIVDWTTANHDYSYYVDGKQGTGQAANDIDYTQSAAALVVEIAMAHHTEINFSDFDGDGDGAVDVIILVVEGWGDGNDDQFWPHMSIIPSTIISNDNDPDGDGFLEFDGVAIKKYIVMPEQTFTKWGDFYKKGFMHPIGTICHELGHVLGLPDLYDNSADPLTAGIGAWGLMGSGNYRIETSPAYMSAWSRYRLGFIFPHPLEDVSNLGISIPPAEGLDVGAAYILPMDSNMPQEYLIIENRQKIGSDEYLKKSGLLVWHIDETITDMYPSMNLINVNSASYGVNLLQADGRGDLYSCTHNCEDSGDPFPGSTLNTSLSSSTDPNTDIYSYDRDADGSIDLGSTSNISLFNIVENEDSISVVITNPNLLGQILAYDEGGPNYVVEFVSQIWAGILITAPDTVVLSGIQTFLPSLLSTSHSNNGYNIRVYSGWSNNQPDDLIFSDNNSIEWDPHNSREGGWIFISLLDEMIILNRGEKFYIEVMNGTGVIYSFDSADFDGSISSGKSYIRIDESNPQFHLLDQATGIDGDWNIRAVMSGLDNFESLSIDIPPIPKEHRIYSNYPNPFNPATNLSIYLANPANVSYSVYDLKGRGISHNNFHILGSGKHEFAVNMEQFSSGVYFYQFVINNENYSPKKMVLMK